MQKFKTITSQLAVCLSSAEAEVKSSHFPRSMLSPACSPTWLHSLLLSVSIQAPPWGWGLPLALPIHISALFNSLVLVSYWIYFEFWLLLNNNTSLLECKLHRGRNHSSVLFTWTGDLLPKQHLSQTVLSRDGEEGTCARYWERKKVCGAEALKNCRINFRIRFKSKHLSTS